MAKKSKAELVATGERIRFTDVAIGAPFFAHGCFWVRTSYDAGTSMASSQERGQYGACNFMQDPKDKFVTAVEYRVGK